MPIQVPGASRQRGAVACAAYCPVTGRPPYGYRPRVQNGEKVFELDPVTAPVVRRIFQEYAAGGGLQAIAERLTADGIPRPSAYDPERNPHHRGSAWSKAAVRAILTNERYVGEQGLSTTRLDCALCDHRCASRHPVTLVPIDLYRQAHEVLAERGNRTDPADPARPAHRYVLRGLLRCELCQRLMQGTWNNSAPYYRCRFPREYARANSIDHPANVYIREDRLLGPLLTWICRSLPMRLQDMAERQTPAIRNRLAGRCHRLRELVSCAKWEPARSWELYNALGMRLTYQPHHHVVQVRTAVLPDVVVLGAIQLDR